MTTITSTTHLQIHVPNPERWWLAGTADMPWLTDPDGGGARRYPAAHERNWRAIAEVVETVGRAIAVPGHAVLPDDPTWAVVDVDVEAADLDVDDLRIINSWFKVHNDAPRSDPGRGSVADGRHRLFGAWKANPAALLPVYSARLLDIDDIMKFAENVAAGNEDNRWLLVNRVNGLREGARDIMRRLPPIQGEISPRYVAELKRIVDCKDGDVEAVIGAA